MWVYFNVPETQYLEYMANRQQHEDDKIELMLANQTKFPQPGKLGAIEAEFNKETGNIAFRADFPNPDGLLRHGQTGTILIHRKVHDAIVIPQRATYEIMDKRYVYVVDKDDVVHRREIVVQNETDDIFVIKKGVSVGDRIVLEGIRQVRDGEKVEYEFRPPEEVMRKPKNHSECTRVMQGVRSGFRFTQRSGAVKLNPFALDLSRSASRSKPSPAAQRGGLACHETRRLPRCIRIARARRKTIDDMLTLEDNAWVEWRLNDAAFAS